MKDFRIGGVPEHFNFPWYLTLRNKVYDNEGINLRWKDYYGGTGEMCMALREKEIDMAVILTEGIVRDIIQGNECKIIQVFIKSPLLWGIHVADNSEYQNIDELKGTDAAISRYGSGSHLMAYVNAENLGWDIEQDLHFKEIKNLNGANGLSFSVPDGITKPPSLVNIFKELKSDLNVDIPDSGNLEYWARQGVFLLNATLTVRAGQAGSHQNKGWEHFTDAVISYLSNRNKGLVFLLWGGKAQKKGAKIDQSKHLVLSCGHPSPLSANKGHWFGNKHFSKTNQYLEKNGKEPINWVHV